MKKRSRALEAAVKVGKGHRLEQLKAGKRALPWQWCPRCGLVALRNHATRRALSKPCDDAGAANGAGAAST